MKFIFFIDKIDLIKIIKITLYLAIGLYPIYFFVSGSMQPSHFFLLIFSILTLFIFKIYIDKYFITFLLFLIYCYIVNIFYFYSELIVFENIENLKYSKSLLFLSYNFIITISLFSFLKSQKEFKIILYGALTAIVIIIFSLCYSFYTSGIEFRFKSYFNNPNQLGYFCVCLFSLIYLFYRNNYISYYFFVLLLIFLIILSMLTLSKAAYISLLLCVFFSLRIFNYKYSKILEFNLILSVIFIFILFYIPISELYVFDRTINMFYEGDSSLEVRGYKVFFEGSSLQALFGMGIKNIINIQKYEIHSTLFMILTSYGLIGFLIFFTLIFIWILDINKTYGLRGVICVCAPSLLYGLTHNGIRFSMFWILFAISIYLSKEFKNKKLKIV